MPDSVGVGLFGEVREDEEGMKDRAEAMLRCFEMMYANDEETEMKEIKRRVKKSPFEGWFRAQYGPKPKGSWGQLYKRREELKVALLRAEADLIDYVRYEDKLDAARKAWNAARPDTEPRA